MTTSTQTEQQQGSILGRFAALLGAHGLREILQSIFLILLARQSQADYGDFMMAFNMGYIVLSITEAGLDQQLIVRLPGRKDDHANLLGGFAVIKSLLFLGAMACALTATVAQGYSGRITALVLILSAGIGLDGIAGTFFSYLRYQGRQGVEGGIRATSSTIAFGYGFTALYLRASCAILSLFTVIWATLNTVLSLLASRTAFLARGRIHPVSEAGSLLKTCWVFVLISAAAMLYNKVNVFFLHRIGGAEAMAQYSATWSIVEGVSALVSNLMLGAVLFPVFARLHSEDREQLCALARNAFNWLLVVSIPLTFVLVVESDRIIGLIYGAGYSDAASLQRLLALAIPVGFLHNLAAYLMLCSGRERSLLAIFSIGLLFSLVLCLLLVPAAPLAGAATAILVAKAAVAAGTIGFCQWKFALIRIAPLAEVALGLAAMIAVYLLLGNLVPREAAELLALIPPLAVALRWWMIRRRRGVPQS